MSQNLIIAVDSMGSNPVVASALLFDETETEPAFAYRDGRKAKRTAKFFSQPDKVPESLLPNIHQYLVTHALAWSTVCLPRYGSTKRLRDAKRLEHMSMAVVRCLERYFVTHPLEPIVPVQIFVPGKDYLPTKYIGSTTQIRFAEAYWQVGAARLMSITSVGRSMRRDVLENR